MRVGFFGNHAGGSGLLGTPTFGGGGGLFGNNNSSSMFGGGGGGMFGSNQLQYQSVFPQNQAAMQQQYVHAFNAIHNTNPFSAQHIRELQQQDAIARQQLLLKAQQQQIQLAIEEENKQKLPSAGVTPTPAPPAPVGLNESKNNKSKTPSRRDRQLWNVPQTEPRRGERKSLVSDVQVGLDGGDIVVQPGMGLSMTPRANATFNSSILEEDSMMSVAASMTHRSASARFAGRTPPQFSLPDAPPSAPPAPDAIHHKDSTVSSGSLVLPIPKAGSGSAANKTMASSSASAFQHQPLPEPAFAVAVPGAGTTFKELNATIHFENCGAMPLQVPHSPPSGSHSGSPRRKSGEYLNLVPGSSPTSFLRIYF